jgi:hypothetical protein
LNLHDHHGRTPRNNKGTIAINLSQSKKDTENPRQRNDPSSSKKDPTNNNIPKENPKPSLTAAVASFR